MAIDERKTLSDVDITTASVRQGVRRATAAMRDADAADRGDADAADRGDADGTDRADRGDQTDTTDRGDQTDRADRGDADGTDR